MILSFTKEEILNKDLEKFYEHVGKQLEGYTEDKKFDCRKINISKMLLDCIYESYRNMHPELYRQNRKEFDTEVTALLLMSGPKVSENLKGYEVEVEEGFLCE